MVGAQGYGRYRRGRSDRADERRRPEPVGEGPDLSRFAYSPEVLERFPAIVGGVIAARVTNGQTPSELRAALDAAVADAVARIGDTPLSDVAALAAWRRAFRAFGVDPTQYRSAAEALLRRVTKQGELPSINALVDLANIVSLRSALPVAVFDQRDVAGGTTVRFADGTERWADLGASTTDHPEAGEVIFVDDAGIVSARRWCWRQSAGSAARDDTTDVLVTVEGLHDAASTDVTAALADLDQLLGRWAAATDVRSATVGPQRPMFDSADSTNRR